MANQPVRKNLQKTREHFASIAQRCIDEANEGKVFVNDLPSYVSTKLQYKQDFLAGRYDNSFTFLQYEHYLDTGESVALLPK